jgi:hypothetical protein
MSDKITQLFNLEPQQLLSPIEKLQKSIDYLNSHFEPKTPTEFLTRQEVATLLKIDLSSVHNWTKKKILISYQIGGRVYYKRKEIENAIVRLNK